jgi:hypothetical protein
VSGGGGSGRETSPGSRGDREQDCSTLRFRTTLSSPQSDVVPHVSESDRLLIDLETINEVLIISARTEAGELVGSVAGDSVHALLRCLQQGAEFQAIVLSVMDMVVDVQIEQRE